MTEVIIQEGGCQCGKVRFRTTGVPVRVTNCYCRQCAKSAGAAFVTWVEFPVDAVSISDGPMATYKSSKIAERGFCPDCGSTLTYQYCAGETLDLAAAAMDDPDAFPPADHIYTASKPSWLAINDGKPQYPRERDEN